MRKLLISAGLALAIALVLFLPSGHVDPTVQDEAVAVQVEHASTTFYTMFDANGILLGALIATERQEVVEFAGFSRAPVVSNPADWTLTPATPYLTNSAIMAKAHALESLPTASEGTFHRRL